MKPVCMFSFDYPPLDGGISRLCAALVRVMDQRGASTRILTRRTGDRDAGVSRASVSRESRLGGLRPIPELKSLIHLYQVEGPIICGLWYPEGLLALLARVRPLVVLAHGAELFPTGAIRELAWSRLRTAVLTGADAVIANSSYTRDLVKSLAPRARCAAVPLAVDHERFSPQGNETTRFSYPGKTVLCSVSRIQPFKGHDMVLEAVARLSEGEKEKILYLVAGQGCYRKVLEKKARELNVDRCTRWLGFVPDDELPDLYRAADLFVLCTKERPEERAVEGFGLVFLEAQACGTPVVGTRTGGIPDAVEEDRGGWLIQPGDIDSLSRIVRSLIQDPDSFQQMGQKARKRVEEFFTWDHYLTRFENALNAKGISFRLRPEDGFCEKSVARSTDLRSSRGRID